MKSIKGITLIALVITIIVLLILAGVSISLVVGDNGVLTQATNAVEINKDSAAKEDVEMAWAGATTKYWSDWANNSSIVNNLEFYQEELEGKDTSIGRITSVSEGSDEGTYEISYTYTASNPSQPYTFIMDAYGKATLTATVDYDTLRSMYGTIVSGYTGYTATDVTNWVLFYVDQKNKEAFLVSRYTIANPIGNSGIPFISSNGSEYVGKSDVRNFEYARKYNGMWLNTRDIDEVYNNTKAVAYMCDPSNWTQYVTGKAKYAAGGPTEEMVIASCYNDQVVNYKNAEYTPENGVKKPSVNIYGYGKVLDSGTLDGKSQFAESNLYYGWYTASPSNCYNGGFNSLMNIKSGYDYNQWGHYGSTDTRFKPVVCFRASDIVIEGEGANKTLRIAE